MKPSEYIERTYAGNRKPCLATIKRMIDRKQLAGEVDAAGKYWVLVDEAGNPAPATQEQAANELVQTGNTLADALMQGWLEKHNAA